MFSCPQCSYETETLNEGYCEDCRRENQKSLDSHNLAFTAWGRLSSQQRQKAIDDACDIAY